MTTVLPAQVEQAGASHRPTASVLLQLVPGAVALLAYVGLVPLAAAVGLPSIAALAAVGLLVVPAVQLGILAVHNRRRPSRACGGTPQATAAAAGGRLGRTGNRAGRCRVRSHHTLDPVAQDPHVRVVAADVDHPARHQRPALRPGPPDHRRTAPGRHGDRRALVEEVYIRGCLLPRMPQQFGPWRTLAHVGLFAAYHLWSPWLMPTRVLAILPLAYIAARTGDLCIGMITHIVLNAADLIVLLLYLRTH